VPAPAGGQESNTVRIDNNVSVLSSNLNPFLVPLYIQHAPDVDAVHIGLDYDELMPASPTPTRWTMRSVATPCTWSPST